jgi:putative SOS response-associated peptidase YedK
MCSRFQLNSTREELARLFDIVDLPEPFPTGVLHHSDPALVILPGRYGAIQRFGIPAPWDARKPLINARAETVAEKVTFQPLLERRCLVPATAYFEWREVNGRKLRNRIRLGERPFVFAAVADDAHFAVLTCAPAASIAHIHDRMPVILDGAAAARWLDPALRFDAVADLLRAAPDDAISAEEEASAPPRQGELFS